MKTSFEGKYILITGAAGGLGTQLAHTYAQLGANLLLASRNQAKLDDLTISLAQFGGAYHTFPFDMTSQHSVDELFHRIANVTDHIDIAINNAGSFTAGELSEGEFEQLININLTGTWRCLNAELALMSRCQKGVIVNISSLIGRNLTAPGLSAYAASKAGVEALSRSLAKEYIGQGVRINTVSPGAFDTEMSLLPGESREERDKRFAPLIPAGRIATLEEVADTVVWVSSNEASFFVGHDFVIDGGASN
ncbi:short-chain dehydrogenase (plasmid) [Vibrio nigripulchritudo]|uniref:SDR family NAD(P)-dependent oxidoreductase n=1 Tax=Vibrio nigripulchritudo TaxID=28173 RepID=UPI00190D44C6|nr:SDR family oxidoreductase [Vibrio nigripulchritudo]BCL73909.1 short-chain dehydrogenase [Vibrio nigripulchritudo]BDU35285.1 short-chain dehydrogenase [Vibrio nigripulchritudo]